MKRQLCNFGMALFMVAAFALPQHGLGADGKDDKYSAIKLLLQQKQFDQAHAQVMALAGEQIPTKDLLALSDLFQSADRLASALALLERQRQYHREPEVIQRLAELYVEADQSEKAIKEYEALTKMDGANREYWLQLGQIYTWNEMQPQAIHAYEMAIKLNPNDMEAISQLAQLYLWNNRPNAAAKLRRVVLQASPGNAQAWKDHGIQSRWNGNNQEAIAAFKQAIGRNPRDAEAFLLLGETLFWENRLKEAEISLRQAVKLDPNERKARFYLAQLNHWRPFGWEQAKKSYEEILLEDPFDRDSQRYLDMLRRQYGPRLQGEARYIDDSNGLRMTELTFLHRRYLSARSEIKIQSLHYDLEETKSAGRIVTHGEGFHVSSLLHIDAKTRFGGGGGFVLFSADEAYGLADVRLERSLFEGQRWPGNLYVTTSFKRDFVLDGVMAIKRRYDAKRLRQNLYWQPNQAMILSADVEKGWYSDNNEKLDVYVEGSYRFRSGSPSLYVNGIYAYQDMRTFYPESEPYWTPIDFWTRSAGVSAEIHPMKRATLSAGYALTQQIGDEFAHNYKFSLDWDIGATAHLNMLYHDYGSLYYAYKVMRAQLSYRW